MFLSRMYVLRRLLVFHAARYYETPRDIRWASRDATVFVCRKQYRRCGRFGAIAAIDTRATRCIAKGAYDAVELAIFGERRRRRHRHRRSTDAADRKTGDVGAHTADACVRLFVRSHVRSCGGTICDV